MTPTTDRPVAPYPLALTGFAPMADRYQGFILDLWGVIHDGVSPYPGAAECLTRLREAGKRVVLLSNAPRRAEAAREGLRRMGIGDDLYTGIMTSGEAAHQALRTRHEDWFAALPPNFHHLGPERDRNIFHGLELKETSPEQAAWVLNTGPDDTRDPTDMALYEPTLQACLAQGLKMLCANPDLEIVRNGRRLLCAGALAARYEELGGEVLSLGKPDPKIYQPVLEMLDLPKSRILAVGDSLRTDIAGAQAAGVDSCWVLGGIHHDDPDPLGTLVAARLGPVATLTRFAWA